MARTSEQKLKILYVKEFLENFSDEQNPVSTKEIIAYLEEKGIKAERKSIYDDIAALIHYGLDIIKVGGQGGGYYLGQRPLELAELKILADAVWSSRFLTVRKTSRLINKLASLLPKSQRKELSHRVHVMSRLKSSNEQIYYNIDSIQQALHRQCPISFTYSEWVISRDGGHLRYHRQKRKNGSRYEAFPFELIWDDENYYLVARDWASGDHRHYRVDRMQEIEVLTKDDPAGRAAAARFDPSVYSRSVFDMYNGRERTCHILFHQDLLGAMIDRFGEDMIVQMSDQTEWYRTVQYIRVSERFFGWVLAFGGKVQLEGPEDVKQDLKDFLRLLADAYII